MIKSWQNNREFVIATCLSLVLGGCMGSNAPQREVATFISPMEIHASSIRVAKDAKHEDIEVGGGFVNPQLLLEDAIKVYLTPNGRGGNMVAHIDAAELFKDANETDYRLYAKIRLEGTSGSSNTTHLSARISETESFDKNLSPGQHYEAVEKWLQNCFVKMIKELQNSISNNFPVLLSHEGGVDNKGSAPIDDFSFSEIKPVVVADRPY